MEQNKLDEKISSAFEKRTIKPSANSWETLNKRLDQNVKESPKKLYYFIAFAASFIGVLLSITFVFKTENLQVIVDTIDAFEETKTIEKHTDNNQIGKEELQQKKVEVTVERRNQNQSLPNSTAVTNQSKPITTQLKETAQNSFLENSSETSQITGAIQENEVAVAKRKSVHSPEEVEDLLAAAQHQLALRKKSNTPRILDYNGLLNEVEDDLEETLRDKMLKTIKSSYYTVRETVAERNE